MATEPDFNIRVLCYGPTDAKQLSVRSIKEIKEHMGKLPVIWVDIEGVIDAASLNEIGEIFSLHSLALEDVLNNHQRAKVEQYGEHHFIVTRMVSLEDTALKTEQLSIFFGSNFVLSFQDRKGGDCLNPVRERIRKGIGKIRQESAEHLAYSLVDAVVDGYFPVVKSMGAKLNALEDEIFERLDSSFPTRIFQLKRELVELHENMWPLQDSLNSLQRDEREVLKRETYFLLRDCYDHCNRAIDLVQKCLTLCGDLMNLHLSSESARMNEILKVLAIISTIFIPPTLIAGIYGMNFNPEASPFNMPELNWVYGYPFALVLMAIVMLGLIGWLWWKGWLKPKRKIRTKARKSDY